MHTCDEKIRDGFDLTSCRGPRGPLRAWQALHLPSRQPPAWCSCVRRARRAGFRLRRASSGRVLLRKVAAQVGHLPGCAVETELLQDPDQVVGQGLPLGQDRQEAPGSGVDQGSLADEPAINMVQKQRGSRGHLDEAAALRGEIRLPPRGPRSIQTGRPRQPDRQPCAGRWRGIPGALLAPSGP